jgi:hypothetical protein
MFFIKIKGVYFDREILLEQLSFDVKISTNVHDLIPITVYSRIDAIQTTNNCRDHLEFLFYQLFIREYCLNSPSTLNKSEFTELINDYYSSNRQELKVIHEFENDYNSSKNVFSWFERECFIRRILTQSLLTLNIQILFSLRFFLHDMFKMMIDKVGTSSYQKGNIYSNRSVNGRLTNEQVFYRGQALTKETFFKIKSNIGKKMKINYDELAFSL